MAYGFMTHSHLNSTEHRQSKRERKEFTKKYESREVQFPAVEIRWHMCRCRSFRLPHDPEQHGELMSDQDWRTPEQRAGQQLFKERIR